MTDRHEHLDEGTIHAWLDGALPPDESARVESLATTCAECAALVAEARGLVAASSRILSSLDAVPGGVIPGVESGTDQLAALRARRRETSRHWWNDRRLLAAASLVFVAGVSTMVWRSTPDDAKVAASEQDATVTQPQTDSAAPVAAAPASPPSNQTARDARVGAAPPAPVPVPSRVAASNQADSAAAPKVVTAEAELSRRPNVAANESRRLDSSSVAAKSQLVDSISAQRAVSQIQLQQGGAVQGQQALRQRAEQARAAAPPPASALGAGSRLGSVVTTGVAADMAAPLQNCYRLLDPLRSNPVIIADSVQLLHETPMELSDPTWYRARAAGWADTALVWRSVDSTTVELRSRLATLPSQLVVRFSIAGQPLPLASGARERAAMAVAVRIRCP